MRHLQLAAGETGILGEPVFKGHRGTRIADWERYEKIMRVLITGSSRGLGYALAEIYAENGHEVLSTARSFRESDQLVKLAGRYPKVRLFDMDVASWSSIEKCAEDIRKIYDSIDLVINNAGVLYESDKVNRITEVDVEALQTTMAVNVEGPILVLKAFYPLLNKSSSPKFYVITSESTLENSWYGIPVYSLSKVAANKTASIIRASVGEQYEVLAIHPGRMNTDMGRTTAQIEAGEAAAGIYEMSTGQREIKNWYVNYLGEKMNS